MSLLKKLLFKEKSVTVPYDCFCAVFNDGRYVQIIESGEHSIQESSQVTPPISFDAQTITVGYPRELNDGSTIFYKLTVQYKITDPYLFVMNADRGMYVSTHATSLMDTLLWNAKTKEEAELLLSKGFVFSGRIAEVVFESASSYGAKILSASCELSSIEEIRSVPHDEKTIDLTGSSFEYIRGYFYNSTGLSKDDLPI